MSSDRTPSGRTPAQTARLIGFVVVGGIALALAVFLLIGWLQGDPTNDLEERQPEPATSESTSP